MAAQKSNIEFIPQEEWEKTALGKILIWSLTVGRWIVIITELVVIIAFLSRFKLDRDLTDLNELIKQQQAIIDVSSEFEKEFRFIQKRVSAIENLRQSELKAENIINELAMLIPIDVTLQDIRVTPKEITLKASSLSESGLSTFIRNLKNSSQFMNVVVTKIAMGEEETVGISFELKTHIKTK